MLLRKEGGRERERVVLRDRLHRDVGRARVEVLLHACTHRLLVAACDDSIDEAIAAGIPVVIASRTSSGPNLERTYRMPGGETDLIERGAIPAGAISGHKARLRLIVGLALDRDPRSLFPVR